MSTMNFPDKNPGVNPLRVQGSIGVLFGVLSVTASDNLKPSN
jgi:hypothetical protein